MAFARWLLLLFLTLKLTGFLAWPRWAPSPAWASLAGSFAVAATIAAAQKGR
jgi:hypothetical protein